MSSGGFTAALQLNAVLTPAAHTPPSSFRRSTTGPQRRLDGTVMNVSPKNTVHAKIPSVGVVVVVDTVVVVVELTVVVLTVVELSVVVLAVVVVVVLVVEVTVVDVTVVVVPLVVVELMVVLDTVVDVSVPVVVVVDSVVVVDDTVVVVDVTVVVVVVMEVVVDVIVVVVLETLVVVEVTVVVVVDVTVVVVEDAVVVVDVTVVVVVVEIVVVVLMWQSANSPCNDSCIAWSSVSITLHPTVDFKKPSTVHSSLSTEVAGFAYAKRAPLITDTEPWQFCKLPADKIIRSPTMRQKSRGVDGPPEQTPSRPFKAYA